MTCMMDGSDSVLDGTEADGEWSEGTDLDDDKTKGCTSDVYSDTEDFGYHSKSPLLTFSQSLSMLHAFSRVTPGGSRKPPGGSKKPPGGRVDNADRILDHIDAELNSMNTLKVPVAMRRRPSKSQLKEEGVMFDTADEDTTHETKHPRPSGVPMIKVSKSSIDRDGTIDTGLGTSSYQDDQMSGDQQKILGSMDAYSDATEDSSNLSEDELTSSTLRKGITPRDLDSDAALQVDHKYKQILKHKRGGLLKGFKTSKRQSDLESIRTEDFEDTFKDIMIMPTVKENSPDRSSNKEKKKEKSTD